MAHRGARLAVFGRRLLVERVGSGRPAWLDRPTGALSRRYEHERPGELVHGDSHQRCYTALGGHPPIGRVDNAAGQCG
ncbi:hypothetical protein [Streptomyces tanashiensis]|uniref:hypothetical protein n=1 Tax=Streptomyces tanashiensis TaxID=67367 RepID=UPI0019881F96|nr:hypothetical protein GCM10010299_23340 [Streptomyces tanashiensis]